MREMQITRRYVHLPVKNGAAVRRMRFMVDGATVREFEIELAEEQPDFWVFSDVSAFEGKRLRVEVDGLPEGSRALDALTQADAVPDAGGVYREQYRPQIHFSPRRGWNNDPNGLLYHDGEYHLYFQHNPYGWKWGNMHWGHAVSRDLVHWQELPIAIYPHRFGDWAFSGSAVVDAANTAGFKTGAEAPLVVAYTSTGRGECIAYSNDRGRTFTDYPGNPVVKHRGRDPKVIWYAPGGHWVMSVYDEQGEGDAVNKGISFYTSPDLRAWEYRSRIEGYYECPEIFELPIDGDPEQTRWVVYAADGAYALGSFDGKVFTPESGKHRFNWGNCFYASQTFNGIPPQDGRRIQIGWGTTGHPSMPFNQMMDFPVELTLRTTEEGIRLFALPVREIETLYGRRHAWHGVALSSGETPLDGVSGDLLDISAEIEVRSATEVGLLVRGIPVTYDAVGRELACQDQRAPLNPAGGRVRLRILADRTSIEIFANDGRIYMPIGTIPPDDAYGISLFARGGSARFDVDVAELRSAWE